MVNTCFPYIKWICTTNILSPQIYSHATPQVGLNSFPPNSTPSETAFHRSNPTNLFISIIHIHIFGWLVVVWNGAGLDLEPGQSGKKESNWPASRGKKSMLSQCLRMVVKGLVVEALFFIKNCFPIGFLRIQSHVGFG